MRKRMIAAIVIILIALFAVGGCGSIEDKDLNDGENAAPGQENEDLSKEDNAAEADDPSKEDSAAEADDPSKEEQGTETDEASYALMAGSYVFSSGAGGWGTSLDVAEDGTFIGQYMDSDMGDMGPDYPDGTVYICNFKGKFTDMKQVDDYIYSMSLEYLEVEGIEGQQYYEDDMRYIYSGPYGFDDADTFMFYLPGIQMSDLPEGFLDWCRGAFNVEQTDTLPYRGIYNVVGEQGFVGWE